MSKTRRRNQRERHPDNTAAKAARSFNQNLRHYRTLHDPSRARDAAELDKMLAAARKNPNGRAAQLLRQIGKMPEDAKFQ